MPKIKLQSSDEEIFDIDVEIIVKCSETISTMLEYLGMDEEEIVPLPNLNSATLSKVLEWATFHKDDPPHQPEDDENKPENSDDISTWDADFMKVERETLFRLNEAANYLNIERLRVLIHKTMANIIKNNSPRTIRRIFNIENDFTADAEKQLCEEHEWTGSKTGLKRKT